MALNWEGDSMKKETWLSRGSWTKLMELNLERIMFIRAGEPMRKENKIQKGAKLRRALDWYFVARLKRTLHREASSTETQELDEEWKLMDKGDQLRLWSWMQKGARWRLGSLVNEGAGLRPESLSKKCAQWRSWSLVVKHTGLRTPTRKSKWVGGAELRRELDSEGGLLKKANLC